MTTINNITNGLTNALNRTAVDAESKAAQREATAGVPKASDQLILTDAATQLQELKRSIANLPVVDEARVEAIRVAIAEGRYQIDPEELARKMIEKEGN